MFWPESATTKTIITLKEGSNNLATDFRSPRFSRKLRKDSDWSQEPLNLQEWLTFVYRQKRKPHFISKVSRLLDKYKDREYVLIENIMKKYRIKEKDLPVPILRILRNQKRRVYGTTCWNEVVDASVKKASIKKASVIKPRPGRSLSNRQATRTPTHSATVTSTQPRVSKLRRRASPIKITRSRRRSFDPASQSPITPSPEHVIPVNAKDRPAPSLQPIEGTPRKDTPPPVSWDGDRSISHAALEVLTKLQEEIAHLRTVSEETQRKVSNMQNLEQENRRLRRKVQRLERQEPKHGIRQINLDGIWCQDDEEIECKDGKLPYGNLELCNPQVNWRKAGKIQCQGNYDPQKRSIVWDDGTEWFWHDPATRRKFSDTLYQLDSLRESIRNSRSRRSSRDLKTRQRRNDSEDEEKCHEVDPSPVSQYRRRSPVKHAKRTGTPI